VYREVEIEFNERNDGMPQFFWWKLSIRRKGKDFFQGPLIGSLNKVFKLDERSDGMKEGHSHAVENLSFACSTQNKFQDVSNTLRATLRIESQVYRSLGLLSKDEMGIEGGGKVGPSSE
jgi:hypothetical protein